MASDSKLLADTLKSTEPSKQPVSIVVGAGSAGLSSVLSLILRNHRVILIDNRTEETRNQRVFMPGQLIQAFYAMSELPGLGVKLDIGLDQTVKIKNPPSDIDIKGLSIDAQKDYEFFSRIASLNCVISIQELHNYMFQKLQTVVEGIPPYGSTEAHQFQEKLNSLMERSEKHTQVFKDWWEYWTKNHDISKIPDYIMLVGGRFIEQGEKITVELSNLFSSLKEKIRTKKKGTDEDEIPNNHSTEHSTAESNLQVLRGPHFKILEVNAEKQVLELQDTSNDSVTEIPFDNLVDATGSRHEMATLLQQSSDIKIRYEALKTPRQEAHGVMVFKIKDSAEIPMAAKRIVGPHILGSSHLEIGDLKRFHENSWNKGYLPIAYMDFNPETRECYLVGEIPESVLKLGDAKNRNEQLFRFGSFILEREFDFKPGDIEKLATSSTFKLAPKCANQNYVRLGKNGLLILLGDAFLSANFLFGHGVTNAITDGNTLYHCFDENGKLKTLDPLDKRAIQSRAAYADLSQKFEEAVLFLDRQRSEKAALAISKEPKDPTPSPDTSSRLATDVEPVTFRTLKQTNVEESEEGSKPRKPGTFQ